MRTRCGYVAIIGRPNAGKSTLFNNLVGRKISATGYKPQTTRHRIVGVRTDAQAQFVFVDTPGIHSGAGKLLNRVLNKNALNVLHDVDLILWVIDRDQWTPQEARIKKFLTAVSCPVILVVNKIDKLAERAALLAILKRLAGKFDFKEIVPVSATKGDNLDRLIQASHACLPVAEFCYSRAYITDRDAVFLASEAVREAAFVYLQKELPYATHVEIETFEQRRERGHICAVIWVEKATQKAILIGRQGRMLKQIGTCARAKIQARLNMKVNLKLWVRLHKDWQDNPAVVGKYES